MRLGGSVGEVEVEESKVGRGKHILEGLVYIRQWSQYTINEKIPSKSRSSNTVASSDAHVAFRNRQAGFSKSSTLFASGEHMTKSEDISSYVSSYVVTLITFSAL